MHPKKVVGNYLLGCLFLISFLDRKLKSYYLKKSVVNLTENARIKETIVTKERRMIMPFVHVELVEGRSAEQKAGLVKDVTAAVVKNTGASAESIHVIINEMKKGDYAVGGKLLG